MKVINTEMATPFNEHAVRQVFGKNLRHFRIRCNLSKVNLAKIAGLSINHINDMENGKKGVSVKTLATLSNIFTVEPHQFFLPDQYMTAEMADAVKDLNSAIQEAVKDITGLHREVQR